jgi:hypothetical protein
LWPRCGREWLIAKERAIGPRAFNRGFRQIAISDEDNTFPSFQQCYAVGPLALGEIQRRAWWPKFTGVDLASSKRPGTAIVTVAVDPKDRKRYPVDVRVGAWRSHETAQMLTAVNELYQPEVIMVENNAYQQSLIDWIQFIKLDYWYKVDSTTTGTNKMSEEVGLPALLLEFHNKSWVIPADEYRHHPPGHHEAHPPCGWCRFDHEFRFHPLFSTSDLVMATWFARQAIERSGYVFDDGTEQLEGLTNR